VFLTNKKNKMIVKNEFLTKLKDFGLNTYESRLWAALLSRGISTAGELSDIANVPRSRTYDVLESLEKKGFIITKLGKPIKYIAVAPSEVVERIKKKIEEDVNERITNLESLKNSNILNELEDLYKKGINTIEPTELVCFIKGRENIYNHIENSIKKAEKSITIITTEEGAKRKYNLFKKTIEKLKDKSIKITFATNLNKNLINDLKTISTKLLHLDKPGRAVIIDGKEITLIITEEQVHPSYETAIWINSEFLSKSFEELIEKSAINK